MKRNNHPGKMIRILLLCLCTAMLAGTAGAEEIVDISDYAFTDVKYQGTLADGRVLLAGMADRQGKGAESLPRLLCLNPDRTVSWDYLDEAAPLASYIGAAVLADGRIGAVLWDNGDEQDTGFTLQFFTPEGEPAGKDIPVPVPESAYHNFLTSSRMVFADQRNNGETNYLLDWKGNRITQMTGLDMNLQGCGVIEEKDGLVLFGASDQKDYHAAAIEKRDFRGKLIWKQSLSVGTDTEGGSFLVAVPAEDGGYLIVQSELQFLKDFNQAGYLNALVKLDRRGKVQWTGTEGLEDETTVCRGLARFGGKIAAFFHTGDTEPDETVRDAPLLFRWFDESGKPLGTTMLNIGLEDFERLGQYTDADSIVDVRYDYHLVPMPDGLWATASLLVSGADGDTAADLLLVKVPEL